MTNTIFKAAALAADIAPELAPSGARESEQFLEAGDREGLETAVVIGASGKEYDTTIAHGYPAVKLLSHRAKAAIALSEAKEPASLRFNMEYVRRFKPIRKAKGPDALAVMITRHYDGNALLLGNLTEAQCGALGAAIAAVHRLNTRYFTENGFSTFTAAQIKKQLTAWTKSLSRNDQIPREIIGTWQEALEDRGMFDFDTRLVHGGFEDGDVLFRKNDISAMLHWEGLQVNDPARDLAWIYTRLGPRNRNALTAAYARVMGSGMDDMILLRARMWVQMEQVGAFLEAVESADNVRILELKARLDHMAEDIVRKRGSKKGASRRFEHPDTMTVGDLLNPTGNDPKVLRDTPKTNAAGTGIDPSQPYTVNAGDLTDTQASMAQASTAQAPGARDRGQQRGSNSRARQPRSQSQGAQADQPTRERLQHFSMPELSTAGLDLNELSRGGGRNGAGSGAPGVRPLAMPSGDTATTVNMQFDAGILSGTVAGDERAVEHRPASVRAGGAAAGADGDAGAETRAETQALGDETNPLSPVSRNGGAEDSRTGGALADSDSFEADLDAPGTVYDQDSGRAGSDNETVMLPAQPLYFDEDSDLDPAHTTSPRFTEGGEDDGQESAEQYADDTDWNVSEDTDDGDAPYSGADTDRYDGVEAGDEDDADDDDPYADDDEDLERETTTITENRIVADDAQSDLPSGDFSPKQ